MATDLVVSTSHLLYTHQNETNRMLLCRRTLSRTTDASMTRQNYKYMNDTQQICIQQNDIQQNDTQQNDNHSMIPFRMMLNRMTVWPKKINIWITLSKMTLNRMTLTLWYPKECHSQYDTMQNDTQKNIIYLYNPTDWQRAEWDSAKCHSIAHGNNAAERHSA